ncbi:MAG TPA: hypothetical protein DEP72_05740 [Clostridiales bacterium]|nr:hypothetical protein [Clostridiales bacterium]
MNYKGVIIEESLSDCSIVKDLEVVDTYIGRTTAREATPWVQQWTLQTVIIPENRIDEYAKKLSNLIDKEHKNSWYCDFRNESFHYVVFSDKVFKLDRSVKHNYEEMRNYGLYLGIPEPQLPRFNDLPTNLLIGFLIEAKKQTYANSNADKVNSSRLGSKDYSYSEEVEGETMTYHDTYFGGVRFIGEEVVYRGTKLPKWGMNYYGVTLNETLGEETMDKVLRPALMKVGEDDTVIPVRGPSRFENDGYFYTFKTDGVIENFTGVEEIYKGGELIYRLHCHGGTIE